MRRPPFIFSRETERTAIDRSIRNPAKRQMLYDMVDAILRVRENGKITASELAPIRAGFDCSVEAIWGRAGSWLAKLVEFSPETISLVDELAAHRSAAVRFRLCATLSQRQYEDSVLVPRLRRLLTDKSKRVRDMAAGVCQHRRLTTLLPEMEANLAARRDPEEREDLQRSIALTQGKPHVESRDSSITQQLPDGDILNTQP